jgi:phosphocarrier protein HPr
MTSRTLTLLNKTGLHARPAALLVETAGRFRCSIRVLRPGREADAKSVLSLMLLEAGKGSEIKVEAIGDDESEAVAAIASLVESRFGEEC